MIVLHILSSLNETLDVRITNYGTNTAKPIFYGEFLSSASQLKILHKGTGESITVNFNFDTGDKITIDHILRKVTIYDASEAKEINGMPYLPITSIFFEMQIGDNFIEITADNGYIGGVVDTKVEFRERHL